MLAAFFMVVAETGAVPSGQLKAAREMAAAGKSRRPGPTLKSEQIQSPFLKATPRESFTLKQSTARPAKAPMRITAGGSSIYGWLAGSSSSDLKAGLYEMTSGGYELKWADPTYAAFNKNTLKTGWLNNGRICGLFYEMYYGYVMSGAYQELDFATGEVLVSRKIDMSDAPSFTICVYNPEDGKVYGYGLNDYSYDYCWMKCDPKVSDEYEVVKEYKNDHEICYAMTYNPADKTVYGITCDQDFVKIGFDGTQEKLFHINLPGVYYYISGLVYSPAEEKFYWNVNYSNLSSALATISLDGQIEILRPLSNEEEFCVLFNTDDNVTKDSPERPAVVEKSFADGSTSGYAVYSVPTRLRNGSAIPSDWKLDAYAQIDGKEYKVVKNVTAGSEVRVDYENITNGNHKFDFYILATAPDGATFNSGAVSYALFVGNDTPEAPANVTLTTTTLTWDPVTRGTHNGYIDASKMTYIVYIDGEEFGRTDRTTMEIRLPENRPVQKYSAGVVAECNGQMSEQATSNRVLYGSPYTIPVEILPNAEQADLCTVYDGNHDQNGWFYSAVYKRFEISYSHPEDGDVDDWVFMPYIQFDSADTYYLMTFEAGLETDTYDRESLEVCVGKTNKPEDMTVKVVDEFYLVFGQNYHEALIKVPEAGAYYLGFHCTSETDQFGLWVKNIHITDAGIVGSSPRKPEALAAVAGENGSLTATVSFRMPTHSVDGNPLDPDTEIEAVVEAAATTKVKALPGADVTVTVETVQSNNEIAVSAVNAGSPGLQAFVSVYTGVVLPDPVTNLTSVTAPDMSGMTLSWDAPTGGENGGYVDLNDISYEIYSAHWAGEGYAWDLIGSTRETTYTIDCSGMNQEYLKIGVASANAAGTCNRMEGVSDIVGLPYNLPMIEEFGTEDSFRFNPWLEYTPEYDFTCQWSFGSIHNVDPAFDDRFKVALIGWGRYDDSKGCLGMPRFTTVGENSAEVVLNVYNGGLSGKTLIYGSCYGMEQPVLLGEHQSTDETPNFSTVTFELPEELLGKDWVQIYVVAEFATGDEVVGFDLIGARGGSSSVAGISGKRVGVTSGDGGITVTGADGLNISVTTVSGITVASRKAESDTTHFRTGSGIYIVRAGSECFKVIVR